jgi:sporulenol synthase
MDWRLLESEIYKRCNKLLSNQQADGTWRYCFENSILTDSFMIIMLQTLEINDYKLINQLTDRILSQQSSDGLWRVYPDEKDGNLSLSIQAFTALMYTGKFNQTDGKLEKAKKFIIQNGGLKNANLLTKAFLAMNGHYAWPNLPIDPALLFSLPLTSPINMYDISSYARAHFAPVFLMAFDKKQITSPYTPDISELNSHQSGSQQWDELVDLLNHFSLAERYGRQTEYNVQSYILHHIEADGTLLSYGLTTIFMIYGLISTGYEKNSNIIQNALRGLYEMICDLNGQKHLQNSPSAIWDTSLILYVLQEAGVPLNHKSIQTGAQFLLKEQQTKLGDWSIHNPDILPGGWGFSIGNTMNPDNDDTQAVLRTMRNFYSLHPAYQNSYQRGLQWLLSMQNDDGGWAAFEKNTNRYILGSLPIKNARDALIDPSTADITGRTLEFLGKYHGFNKSDPLVKKGMNWLWNQQEIDGSWYGRWGICYIYGTWAAITGLMACGINPEERRIQRSLQWLLGHQNEDGGWGESCRSDSDRQFVKLQKSTPSQTAWALDTLIAINRKPTPEMNKAISFLLENESSSYPTGAGLADSLYIRYHSYDHIWPLLSIVHFYKKYNKH